MAKTLTPTAARLASARKALALVESMHPMQILEVALAPKSKTPALAPTTKTKKTSTEKKPTQLERLHRQMEGASRKYRALRHKAVEALREAGLAGTGKAHVDLDVESAVESMMMLVSGRLDSIESLLAGNGLKRSQRQRAELTRDLLAEADYRLRELARQAKEVTRLEERIAALEATPAPQQAAAAK